ncbi:MAG: cell wall metabolism sensor histidine kinase WalK [Clostridia bacterium]|jgi:signal transduction histidine kinase|nr:cell wall metabolism sensor histidine kinase WalK [Clostridia bacterium]
METHFIRKSEFDWLSKANGVAVQIKEANYLQDASNYNLFMSLVKSRSNEKDLNCRIVVVDKLGFVVADSSGTVLNKTVMNSQVFSALSKKDQAAKAPDEPIMTAAVSVVDKNDKNKVLGAVILSANIEDIYISLDKMKSQVYLLSLVASLFTGLISFITSSFITKPLKALMKFVQRITTGQLDQKVDVVGKDEIAELGNAFNHMAEQLQRVEQSRQEFVSNVSHELKTPLSSIKVLTESLIFEENVPVEMYQEFFQDINSEVDRLNNIISDLLTLVRLDQREIPMNITNVDLTEMTQNILKRLVPLAKKKEIKLIYESHKDITAEIDEVKFTLALSNLIENAIKYTPNGGEVKVIVQNDVQDAFITIQDTGIGISKKEQSKIFERFYRTDKTRNRETGGTGLGLAITYKTVVMHNGSIQVESEEGEGSIFIVQVPLRHAWKGAVR